MRAAAIRAPALTRVASSEWRDACLRAQNDGERFEGMFAARGEGDDLRVRALFATPASARVITCEPTGRTLETLVDVIPAVAWDEREAADRHRLTCVGHEPLRPLLDHHTPLEQWTVPVGGHDVHQVAVGPVHAGVIESGHFRFHLVGERILHLDVQLFYKRRGLEDAAAGRRLTNAILYIQRACAACAVGNTLAYAQACEMALGLEPDDQLRRARTVLAELERVYNHLHDISAICAGVGLAPGTMAYAALKERVQRLCERISGHRFLFDSVTVAAGNLSPLEGRTLDHARGELRELAAEHATSWRQLQFVSSLQDRLAGVGVLTGADAERLGAVGPAARAAGIHEDVRSHSPHLHYVGFDPAIDRGASGDVASRMTQRAIELEQSFGLLDELLTEPLEPGRAIAAHEPGEIGIGRVESPRGRTVCLIERDGERLRTVHLRTASYANWPVVAHAVTGNLLPDFPLINKSFELCYACVDR